MVISLQLNEAESNFVNAYAARNNIDPAELARRALIEKLEDEEDLRRAEAAMAEFRKNPVTYSHEEVGRLLGLR